MSEQLNDFDRIYERCLTQDCPPSEEAEERVYRCHLKIRISKRSKNCKECWRKALKGVKDLL